MCHTAAERYRIAAIVPCHNEEAAVAKVVADLQAAVPGITVYVYDNCSTDRTIERAREAGAIVCSEPHKGKGNVVRRAFADIDADIYLLIDGDDTYDAARRARDDRASWSPRTSTRSSAYVARSRARELGVPAGHETGNKVLNRIVTGIFGDTMGDMLSGYRVFSRRFVKSFPAVSREFEIETELTVHSLALRIPSATVRRRLQDRAEGSESKLRTYRDGWRILNVIMTLTRHERPIYFFGLISGLLMAVAVLLAIPVLVQYVQTGLVPRMPDPVRRVVPGDDRARCSSSPAWSSTASASPATRSSRLSYMRYPAVRGTYVKDPDYYPESEVVARIPSPRTQASTRIR